MFDVAHTTVVGKNWLRCHVSWFFFQSKFLYSFQLSICSGESVESVVSQHRALVFCQLKTMLDILEDDLLKVFFFNPKNVCL